MEKYNFNINFRDKNKKTFYYNLRKRNHAEDYLISNYIKNKRFNN